MKVLLTASVLSHICQFHKPLIRLMKEAGHCVHIAARDNLSEKNGLSLPDVDAVYNINFHRSPFSPKNIPAYLKLKKIIDTEHFDIIHCNTPAVGVLSRLAARKARKQNNTKVIYTAHGFHFYKGAPLKNWIMYYPIEKFMCRYTDTLMTICQEDYELAKQRFHTRVERIHGVGADEKRFFPVSIEEKLSLRKQLNLPKEAPIILCTGELNKNKNQAVLIKALPAVILKHPNIRVLLAGNGPEKDNLLKLISSLNLEDSVQLLGYRTDLDQLVKAADIIVSCSIREGLGLNIIEGMLCKKTIIASINRGHSELIEHGTDGLLFSYNDEVLLTQHIIKSLSDKAMAIPYEEHAYHKAQQYSESAVLSEISTFYSTYIQ